MQTQPIEIFDYTIANLKAELSSIQNPHRTGDAVRIERGDQYPIVFRNTGLARLLKWCERLGLEAYWSATRAMGLGHLHDGSAEPRMAPRKRPVWKGAHAPRAERGRILVAASSIHATDRCSGIPRVTRKLSDFVVQSGEGAPFILEGDRLVSYYRGPWPDEIDLKPDDTVLLVDVPTNPDMIRVARLAKARGARVILIAYDLIPIRYPGLCASTFPQIFKAAFDLVLGEVDGVIAISRTTAHDLQLYLAERTDRSDPPPIGWAHLGADFAPVSGMSRLSANSGVPTDMPYFLGVGTIEPRKAWNVALDSIELLWTQGVDARLVLAGRYGWSSLWLRDRILGHPEFGKRLIWLSEASDAQLAALYRGAAALVYPSICEGFGLPLIEAKHYGAPVIASDIPIFREIARDGIIYFRVLDADALAARMTEVLRSRPSPPNFRSLDWARSCAGIMRLVHDLVEDRPNEQRLGPQAVVAVNARD